ncbi:MAG: TetR/AcrR family transcriptional regulator [Chrysiogenetes bacterium]|nr:TetR/AcrR family transcriptional regulator [Chrysiogenetes bacterium]
MADEKTNKARAEKHDRILSAAAKIFARKGFFNAKISEIAREAQVADGTIYLYFKSKDDILIHLFEEMMGNILGALRQEIDAPGLDSVQRIERFILFHLHLVETHPDMAEVITIELRQSHKFMKEYVPRRFFDYLDAVSNLIIEGQRAGMIRDDLDPRITRIALFGALDEVSLQWLRANKEQKFSLNEAGRHLSQLFLQGLQGAPKGAEQRLSG